MTDTNIKKIVVVGGGTAGWMAAAGLAKFLGTPNLNITLVESEQIGTVGVGEATIPLISMFNRALELDEQDFVRETNATFKLGIEFANWKKLGHSYFHPFGAFGVDWDGIPFSHFWLRWKSLGGGLDSSRFNVETEAARELKFMNTDSETGPRVMPRVNYAYHFDASLYAAYLRKYAEKRGVERVEGKIVAVDKSAEFGTIEKLRLDNGKEIEGDFFIDCSGFSGLLIEKELHAGFEDWSHWLPVDRAVAVPCENSGPLLPYTRSTGRDAGWQWRIPLQHRVGNGYVFSSQYISEDEATAQLLESLDGKPLADPKVLRFTTGFRKKGWDKNCIALGLSGGFLEPLESTSIHLVQLAISKLLAYFPMDKHCELESARFNMEMREEYENIKDFLISHYHVTERDDTPFWQYVKNMSIPESLDRRLKLFKSRGEVLVKHQELFKNDSWFAVLTGQGLMPEGFHPVAAAISEDELRLRLTKVRSGIQKRIEMMPTHEEYIRQNCASPMMKM